MLRRLMKHVHFGVLATMLVAGAVINVLVAWMCVALRSDLDTPTGSTADIVLSDRCSAAKSSLTSGKEVWYWLSRSTAFGFEEHEVILIALPPEEFVAGGKARFHNNMLGADRTGEPAGDRAIDLPIRSWEWIERTNLIEHAAGWPMLAAHCGYHWKTGAPVWGHEIDDRRALPLRIIPLGFAVNTIFYACLLWLIVLMPCGVGRRGFRRWRGRCVACNYDLSGTPSDVCPECGHATPGTTSSDHETPATTS